MSHSKIKTSLNFHFTFDQWSNSDMKSSVHSSVKDATSTVSPVIEIDPKEERALVGSWTQREPIHIANTLIRYGVWISFSWRSGSWGMHSSIWIRPTSYDYHQPKMRSALIFYQSNAYVSGMETDLKLYGNELNYFTTFFKYVLIAFVSRNSHW